MSVAIQNSGSVNQAQPQSSPPIALISGASAPEFEKAQVATVATKISGSTVVDSFGESISIDDRIRVVGEFKVVKVSHEVQKDGSVARVQYVAPCGDLQLVPWDPSDPADQGILRARP